MAEPYMVDLHIWPSAYSLSSVDPPSLAAVLYLQLAIPGRYSLVECTTPDSSPSGQLPYISHELSHISSLSSIMKYVSGLPGSLDLNSSLTTLEKSQTTAWCSHATSHLGDLVAYAFYSSSTNYWKLTHPTLAKMLPIPQRYYVPNRIRESYKPRLQSAELWDPPRPEGEQGQETSKFGLKNLGRQEEDPKEKMRQRFAREQILDKARICLDIYSKLLGARSFFFNETPSLLDIIIASHIMLLLNAPLPDSMITDLLVESYPSLTTHARLVLSWAFPFPSSMPPLRQNDSSQSWRSLIPRPRFSSQRESDTEVDRQFAKMRWGWIGLALLSTAAYFWVNPLVIVIEVSDDAVDEEPKDDQGEEEEDVEDVE